MYQVNLGSKILYYPSNAEYAIYDTELTEDVGQAGEFRFKVPSTNPLYSERLHSLHYQRKPLLR